MTTTPLKNRYVTKRKAEEWLIEKSRTNVFYFIWYILKLKPARHHLIWLDAMFNPELELLSLVAARNSAKSTISCMAIAWLMGKYPTRTHAILSVSASQSQIRLGSIRDVIAYSAAYHNVFPHIAIDPAGPDNKSSLQIMRADIPYGHWRQQLVGIKDPTLQAYSVGSRSLIGSRISGVQLWDDVVDGKSLPPEIMKKTIDYLIEEAMPCNEESAKIWCIGTRWGNNDVAGELKQNPEWKTIEIPAILKDDDMKEYSYWPEEWPLTRLYKVKRKMNNDVKFKIMYLCDPSATTKVSFTEEMVSRDLPKGHSEYVTILVTTDFAVKKKETADWNVLICIGVTKNGDYHLLDGERYREEAATNLDNLIAFCDKMAAIHQKFDMVVIESVAFQAVFKSFLEEKRPDIPCVGHVPKGDKEHRAKNVQMLSRAYRLFISQIIDFIEQLHSEFMNFGNSKYDDIMDSVSLGVQYMMSNGIIDELEPDVIESPFLL
jgi:phage terminase large subunit-like protein